MLDKVNLPAGVSPLGLSKEKLLEIWVKMMPYDSLLSDDSMKDPEVFVKELMNQTTQVLEVDGGLGLIFLRNIRPHHLCEVHLTFWDHKLSSRTELLKRCLEWGFEAYDLLRIETFVAEYAKAVRWFLEKRLGFTYEGCLRHRGMRRGKPINVKVYSILREEILPCL